MLHYCGFCGHFKREKNNVSCGWCLAGHRKEHANTTFSTNTCQHFKHQRYFDINKIRHLTERRLEKDGYI